MLEPVQHLIDVLAERLQRSVAVDDVHFTLLGSSRHFGEEDPVRVGALVGRRPAGDAVAHVMAQGIRSLQHPARVTGDPGLGLKDRICVPLRHASELLGYLWLIDDEALSDADLEAAAVTGDRLAEVLAHRRRLDEESALEQETLVRELLDGESAIVGQAVQDLVDLGLMPAGQHYVVFVSTPRTGKSLTPAFQELLGQARSFLQSAYFGETATTQLSATVGEAVATISANRTPPGPEQVLRMCDRLNAALIRRDTGLRWPSWVTASGDVVPELTGARRSFEQAWRSVEIARAEERATTAWTGLSPRQTVLALLPSQLPAHLAPHLADAVWTRLTAELRDTVRRFLDNAGDAAQVAQELHVHRSTVYYRLSRVERLLDLSLSDGTARTAVHLCLILGPTNPGHVRESAPDVRTR